MTEKNVSRSGSWRVTAHALREQFIAENVLVYDGHAFQITQDFLAYVDTLVRNGVTTITVLDSSSIPCLIKISDKIFDGASSPTRPCSLTLAPSIEALIESKSLNAGGAQRYIAETVFEYAVKLSTQSNFGSGGAQYKNNTYSGYADTVFLGCYYTKILKKIGGFAVDLYWSSHEDYYSMNWLEWVDERYINHGIVNSNGSGEYPYDKCIVRAVRAF